MDVQHCKLCGTNIIQRVININNILELKISSGIDLDHMGNSKNHGIVSLLSDVLPKDGGMQVFNSRNTPEVVQVKS